MADTLFTDQALQQAYQALMRENMSGHIEAATWDRVASGEIDQAGRDVVFDHVVTCHQCSRIWRGVLQLRSEAETQGLVAPSLAPRAAWMSPPRMLAVAATLVVVIGGLLLSRRSPLDTIDLTGQGSLRSLGRPIVEGLNVTVAADGDVHLSWSAVGQATAYRVNVFTVDGLPVWTRTVTATTLGWPNDVPRAAGAYRWSVEAMDGDVVLARSRIGELAVVR